MSELLDRDALVDLLADLARRLDARGVTLEIYVVGGTAMVLAYDRDRLTRDIDATWDTAIDVSGEVSSIAMERGLPRDWLNDRVRPMLPLVVDEDRLEALNLPGLRVSVASPRHMLAMKAPAARDARDLDDIVLLCRHLGISSVTEVIALAEDIWGAGMLRDDTVFALRTGLPERGMGA